MNCFELQELLEASLPNDYVKSCATLEVARLIITAIDVSLIVIKLNPVVQCDDAIDDRESSFVTKLFVDH